MAAPLIDAALAAANLRPRPQRVIEDQMVSRAPDESLATKRLIEAGRAHSIAKADQLAAEIAAADAMREANRLDKVAGEKKKKLDQALQELVAAADAVAGKS